MKVSSALCALSFASWAVAAPMVVMFKHTPPKYSGSRIASSDTWPIRTSKFAIGNEAAAQDALEGRPDNSPYSPPSDVSPSAALAAPRPLETSYLLAIKPFMLPAQDKAPKEKLSAPQSDFPESSTVEEETGSVMRHHPTTVELETEGNKPFYQKIPSAAHQGHFYLVRRYADMTVVGIVVVFIALIALIELWGPICRTADRIWQTEGRIRLEDSPNEKEVLKRQFSDFVLQAPPKSRSTSSHICEPSNGDS